jgi:hypothetical protein
LDDKPEWHAIKAQGIRCISWEEDDPLADSFLLTYGAYPPVSETGVDYNTTLFDATMAIQLSCDKAKPLDPQILNHPNVGYIARHGLSRHHSVRSGGWNSPGFFIGDANNLEDLVTFWNLRAADIRLSFIDLSYPERYQAILPLLKANLQQRLASLPEHRQHLAIWTRSDDNIAPATVFLGDGRWSHYRIGDSLWNGLNTVPPMMMLGDASSMGVIGNSGGKPSVSFTLNDRPFSGDNYFFTQRLVASIQVYGDRDEATTFHPPYLPELNEKLARSMHGIYSELRSEPERLGIVIQATDHDQRLNALSVSELIQESFALAGLKARPSSSGLIARQLISRLGGIDGARVFKIPGARKLLKTYGPNAVFTRNAALRQIGGTPTFSDHERLYIEPRPHGTKLTPQLVFEYLVEKELFRIGMELTCPSCNLPSWIALDSLQQTNKCEMCGNNYDATRQIVGGEFRYRRTGVLGIEKNTQGAVPVALLLQQLGINLRGHHRVVLAPSYDLEPFAGVTLPVCETDFVVIENRTFPDKSAFIVGECKDEGDRIDEKDISNLKKIADAIQCRRFKPYILLARLSPFSPEEIALARTINGDYEEKVILLTQRELEPYHVYERVNKESGTRYYGGTAEELARTTAAIYFSDSTEEAS